jgi:hypothetical protein
MIGQATYRTIRYLGAATAAAPQTPTARKIICLSGRPEVVTTPEGGSREEAMSIA